MKLFIIFSALFVGGIYHCYSQKTDTSRGGKVTMHPYFIIAAGTQINAYFNDKPIEVETIEEFNDYVQKNAKALKDSKVVVTGKPKVGTFDEVIKTLSRYKIKNVSKEISKDP